MTIYSIPTPEKLREGTDGIQWNDDYRAAMAFADRWDMCRDAYTVTLELGEGAAIMVNGSPLATMYTAAARDYAKELTEI